VLTVAAGTDILGSVHPPPSAGEPATALRSARVTAGMSQSEAARRLVALAESRGAPAAAPASLKTQLSRWENGHALPEPHYRELLAELYGRSMAELGLAPAGPDPGADLRGRLAAAAAVDDGAVALWREQIALTHRLDAELGAAGTAGPLRALVAQLAELLLHCPTAARRRPVAAVLAEAAALAGHHALDAGDPDVAWRTFRTAHAAATEADTPALRARAAAGLADVLVDLGAPGTALDLLADEPAVDGEPALHLALARCRAAAATGDRSAAEQAYAAAGVTVDQVRPAVSISAAALHGCWGRALLTLGDRTATDPLRRALAADPPTVRERADLHADLALSLTGQEPEEAARHARAATDLAARIGAPRITQRLRARSTLTEARSAPEPGTTAP